MAFDDDLAETTFSPYLWVQHLTDDSTAARMLATSAPLSQNAQEQLVRGYTLLLAASLHVFLDSVIRTPQVVDLPLDEGLRDAWSFSSERGRSSFAALARKGSPVSYVFNSITDYWGDLLRVRSWEDAQPVRIALAGWANRLGKGFRYSHGCRTEQHRLRLEPNRVLRPHAIDWLWPHMASSGLVAWVYSDVYKNRVDSITEDDRFSSEEFESPPLTRLEDGSRLPSLSKRPPNSWSVGYAMSLGIVLQRLDTRRSSDVERVVKELERISNWRDLDILSRRRPLSFKASRKTHIEKVRPFPSSCLRSILLPVKGRKGSASLLGIFGCPSRIVERNGLSAPANFERTLDGMVASAKRYGEKVRVLDLVHKEAYKPVGHSLAILMPVHTWISNWSTWWVFFDVYDEYSRGEDNENGTLRMSFQTTMSRLRKSLDLVQLDVTRDDLLLVSEDPGFSYLRSELIRAKNINWNLRGALPELLGAAYLGAIGCHPVRLNAKPRFLGGRELDVLGVRWRDNRPQVAKILEFKGSSVSDDAELGLQLDRFAQKVAETRRNRRHLADELNLSLSPQAVEGYFVSMADIGHLRLEVPKGVRLWSYDDFVEELRRNSIPTWHLDLLRRASVAAMVAFGEIMQDLLLGPRLQFKRKK